MNRKVLPMMITVAVATAIVTFIITGLLFRSPSRNTLVPQEPAIQASFPDINNNASYKNFLNPSALDPTQTVQIGGTQNTSPF